MAQDDDFNQYVRDNLAVSETQDQQGTAIPADSLAQIMQDIIRIEPELKYFFGAEIRTGYMDDETYIMYTRLLMYAHHILIRGKMFGVKMTHTVKDILFAAKVIASASTSKGGKLLDTLIMSKREVTMNLPRTQKKSFLSKG
jgi:hypothetical protein